MNTYARVLNGLNTSTVPTERVVSFSKIFKDTGFRFVTMSSSDLGDAIDLIYHFDKDLDLRSMRVIVPKGSAISSITSVFACALLVENEIKEHFGVDFEGLPIDFNGTFYLDEEVQRTPFCKIGIAKKPADAQEV
ncbi:NADH-quinone oxidoreductase subunit C [Geomonas sp. RF6]|uniref:NADH-quinone oxidoreductase subunit C n=1 Tax=Geomonas sp. RF6 TaxID=2897342 RepID=UPI001E42C7A1|nr:NADH-quinone oxidoreductase subunit C [Geomonas sp. RF6]UFS70414.1 NADH-quinone oxidoreductase subunit C [Geomonas sp. RF6]